MEFKTGYNVKPESINLLGEVTFTDGTNSITPNQKECEAYGYTYDEATGTCKAYMFNTNLNANVDNANNVIRGKNNTTFTGTNNTYVIGENNIARGLSRNNIIVGSNNEIDNSINNTTVLGTKGISTADNSIVLGGNVGIEMAAKKAGHKIQVPFTPGRGDARQDQTDVNSFGLLEPKADGFRNYIINGKSNVSAEEKLIDKAQLMGLTAPEMTVLVGGMRVLDTNYDSSKNGVFTKKPGTLSTDYFVNLLDMSTTWKETDKSEQYFVGKDRKSKKTKWKGSRVDLIFGSNSQLRALAEVYACKDSSDKFVKDFVSAWVKVMNADRFDLRLN